jgi:dipeptidyl aminopeptidase/acylaminoacyl peptidase
VKRIFSPHSPALLAALVGILVAAAPPADGADEPVVAPPEALVIEGVPKIPVSLAETVGPYTEFRAAGFTGWHPTRHEMAIATRFGNVTQAHVVKSPGGARTQVTFYPDRVPGGRFDPKTGDTLLFSKDTGGNEFFQLYRYDFADGKTTLLTDGKSRNTGARWSNGGASIAYGSTRRTGNDVDIWVVDAANPKSDRLVVQNKGGGWEVADWSPDDKTLLVAEGLSINESYLWLVDVATGKTTELTPRGGEKVAFGNAAFAKDGKGLYVTTDKGSEFQRLAAMDLASKKVDFLTPDTADVDEFDLSPDGKTIAYVANEKGVGVLHLFDTAGRKELPGPRLPLGTLSGVRWHKDGSLIGFTLETARANSDAYSWDVKTGKLDRWTFSETGGLNANTFSEPELISWKSFDGREITGFLYKPPAKFAGKRPVLIEIHGGPEGQSRPDFLGPWNYVVNELGVAVIQPNIRGSTGYGKTYSKLDNGELREGAYKDIGALLDWVQRRPDLDAERVLVGGGSYGGHMTLVVSYLYSDRIRCSVDVVGPSNLVTFLQNTSGYRQDLRRVEYGDERDPKVRAFLEKTAPMNNVDKIKKPLFVIQGYNDPRVPRTESEQMVQKIRGIGTPVWYLMAKDEGHGFAKKSNRDYQFDATILFMKQYLLNEK